MSSHHRGTFWLKVAVEHGFSVKNGKGDHAKIIAPAGRGYMTVPLKRELSTGVECKIRKWFVQLGVVVAVITITLILIGG